jgi:hypothetical protein
MIRKILDCFKHDFINVTTGATAYKEDILSYKLATWMGIERMATRLKGRSLTTRSGDPRDSSLD